MIPAGEEYPDGYSPFLGIDWLKPFLPFLGWNPAVEKYADGFAEKIHDYVDTGDYE